MSDMTRRQFLAITGSTLAGSSLALLGFSPGEALAEVREFKLARATETRNTCPYCSVSCGVLMYSASCWASVSSTADRTGISLSLRLSTTLLS